MSPALPFPSRPSLDEAVSLLQARLNRLPGTPAGIAEFLEGECIAGEPTSAIQCALGRWLSRNLHPGWQIYVDFTVITIRTADGNAGPSYEFPVLPNLRTFIERYDAGQFPALVNRRPATAA